MKYKLLTIVLIACMAACKSNDDASTSTTDIRVPDVAENIPLNETGLLNSIEIIQPSADIIVGNIDKIAEMDSFIYILDQNQMQIRVIDRRGNNVGLISSIGHGANEYTYLSDFFVDTKAKTVNLVCWQEKKLLVYDADCSQLLRTIPLPKTFY